MPPPAVLAEGSLTVPSGTIPGLLAPRIGRTSAAAPGSIALARGWFALAIGSLVLAGLLSLLLVVGRLPFLSSVFTDPLFFRRALVVHVDLALVVWFQAGALAFLAFAFGRRLPRRLVAASFVLCGAGLTGLLTGAVMPGAQPILCNYVPVIDHPAFLTGLVSWLAGSGLFFAATLLVRDTPAGVADEVAVALRACAAGNLIALATFLAAWVTTPADLPAMGYYELLAWGGGHALQAANVALMLALWLHLLRRWSQAPALSPAGSRWLLAALIAPHALLPFAALRGTTAGAYVALATDLMRWTLFPTILVVLGLGVRHYLRHRPAVAADHRIAGLAGSATLALLGLVLGACIRGSNTLVPGHYHAAIGAVTLALMTAAYDFVADCAPVAGAAATQFARARRQLLTFGLGQVIFALGFGWAGLHGLGRKQYGAEQHVRTAAEYAGLGVMGVGGLLAVAGGVLFLALMIGAMRAWFRPAPLPSSP